MTRPVDDVRSAPAAAPRQAHSARRRSVVAGLAVLGGGVLMAVQSRANGTLGVALGDPVLTAIWSIGSGWLLFLLLFVAPGPRDVLRRLWAARREGVLPGWMFLGGVFGGLLVTTQAYAVPLAGVALVLICIVAGQTLSALWVDHVGLGPGGAEPITPARMAAAAATLVGVAVAVGPRVGTAGAAVALPAIVALLVGGLLSLQAATNGRVNVVGRNPFVTTWINFSWGLLVVLLAGAVRAVTGAGRLPVGYDAPWWAWTGGLLGLIYVGINAVAVRRVGVLLMMLLAVTGQLSGALVLDLLDPTQRGHVTVSTVAGVLITFTACVAAGWAAQRARRLRSLPAAG